MDEEVVTEQGLVTSLMSRQTTEVSGHEEP